MILSRNGRLAVVMISMTSVAFASSNQSPSTLACVGRGAEGLGVGALYTALGGLGTIGAFGVDATLMQWLDGTNLIDSDLKARAAKGDKDAQRELAQTHADFLKLGLARTFAKVYGRTLPTQFIYPLVDSGCIANQGVKSYLANVDAKNNADEAAWGDAPAKAAAAK